MEVKRHGVWNGKAQHTPTWISTKRNVQRETLEEAIFPRRQLRNFEGGT